MQLIALVLTRKNKETKHYIHSKHKGETEMTLLANKTIYNLSLLRPPAGKWSRPILTASEPTRGFHLMN